MPLKDLLENEFDLLPDPLTPSQKADLLTFAMHLRDSPHKATATWNNDAEGICMHFRDAFLSLPVVSKGQMLDVGTGAGIPGLIYGILMPRISLSLLESNKNRIATLKALVQQLGMMNRVELACGRAEELANQPDLRESFDLVTARALATLPSFFEYTAPFVRLGGIESIRATGAQLQL